MKYRLESIPVWDALGRGLECLLCDLEADSERRNTEFFLGSSVMAPEMRVELNTHGFCPRHFHMLADGTGKLGYSLALATHIDDIKTRFGRAAQKLIAAETRRQHAERAAQNLVSLLLTQESDCLMCDRIQTNVRNYAYTLVTLYRTEPEFRRSVKHSRGICLHHLPLVLRMGLEVLSPAEYPRWHETMAELVTGSLERLGTELEQFTWQFDFTTERRTPETARDAVARAVSKLAGYGPPQR